jgi:osmotically-inducible protein OsmY
MSLRRLISVFLLVASGPLLAACGPSMWIGAGAKVGVAVAQERSIGDQMNDTAIAVSINERLFSYNEELFQDVSVDVTEGRVLLAGVVDKPEDRVDAVRLAWQVSGVKQVMNEIQVTQGDFEAYTNDVWISTQLRNDLLWDKDISSINYTVETVHGVVYLTGVARSQAELDRVIAHARTIAKVHEVVSYVRVIQPGVTADIGASG